MKRTVMLCLAVLMLSCSTYEGTQKEVRLEANNAYLVDLAKKQKDSIRILKRELRQQKRDSIKLVRAEKAKKETNFVRTYRTGVKMMMGVGVLLLLQAASGK